MAEIIWGWKDFWNYWENIEDERDKTEVLKQVDAKWIVRVTAEGQVKIFEYAPLEIIKQIAHYLKPEAQYLLGLIKNKPIKRRK